MDELDEFKNIIEMFFKCRDELVEIGFVGFRLSDGELTATHPKGPGSVRVRCILKDLNAGFEVDGEGDLAKPVRHLLTHEFGPPLVQIAVARFVIGLFDCESKFLAVVVQFLGAMVARSNDLDSDWGQSMAESTVIAAEHRAVLQIAAVCASLSVEFRKTPGERQIEILAIDEDGAGAKFKTVKDLLRWVDSSSRSS
jgi:hypothetical protein